MPIFSTGRVAVVVTVLVGFPVDFELLGTVLCRSVADDMSFPALVVTHQINERSGILRQETPLEQKTHPITLRLSNIAMEHGPGLKMYFLSKKGIFHCYSRWTNYSNPGQLYPPRPPNFKVVVFFQGLRRVDKTNQTPQHDISRTHSLTLTFGEGGVFQSFPRGLNILSIYGPGR